MNDREKLLNILMDELPDTTPWDGEIRLLVERLLDNGVVVREKGEWKYYRKQGIAVCTSCSFERKLGDNFGRAVACPNCGAKMDWNDYQ